MAVGPVSGRVAAVDRAAFAAVHLPPTATPDLHDRIGEWLANF
jgi:hypothetical protein